MKTYRSSAATIGVLMALATATAQQFTEITTDPVVTDLGGGGFGGWADYDNDGYADLFVVRDLGTTAIYRNNRNGTFSSIPKPPGLAAASYYSAYWCDFDNDGNQDVYALVNGTPHIGYGNGQGDFTPEFFTDASGSSAAYADYDRDGFIDNYQSGGNSLVHNRGNRDFVTYTSAAELGPAAANTYGGPCWGDFDDDGWPDVYAPSLWQQRSYLFRNDGNGGFAAITNLVTQTVAPALQGAWGDYDNDDWLDLFVACWNGTSALYRNLGNGDFERPETGPSLSGTHNFAAWIDYDNDGFLDLWVSGYMSGNKLFRSNGAGGFTQVTDEPIVTEPPPGGAGTYQVAWFDYDNDGFLDACLLNGDDNSSIWTANQLFHNSGNENAWLTVRPIGTVSNRDGVGAKVRVLATYAGQPRWQRRDITGGGLSNGNHSHAHFGLGDATMVDVLRIEWPSGIVQEFRDVTAKRILTVTEPPRLIPQGIGAFRIQSWINQSFDVEASTDLATWSNVATVTNTTGTLVFEDAGVDQHASRYYRVVTK